MSIRDGGRRQRECKTRAARAHNNCQNAGKRARVRHRQRFVGVRELRKGLLECRGGLCAIEGSAGGSCSACWRTVYTHARTSTALRTPSIRVARHTETRIARTKEVGLAPKRHARILVSECLRHVHRPWRRLLLRAAKPARITRARALRCCGRLTVQRVFGRAPASPAAFLRRPHPPRPGAHAGEDRWGLRPSAARGSGPRARCGAEHRPAEGAQTPPAASWPRQAGSRTRRARTRHAP